MDLALPSKGDRGGQGVGGALQEGVAGPGLDRRCKPQIRDFPFNMPLYHKHKYTCNIEGHFGYRGFVLYKVHIVQ